MFQKVFEYFKGDQSLDVDTSGNPTSNDIKIATGVLLLEMAGADDDYAPEEIDAVFRTIESAFKITDKQALELLEMADTLRSTTSKIDSFVATINQHFSEEQKVQVLAMIWQVIKADKKVDKFEKRFAEQMKNRLQLSNEQAAQAIKLADQKPIQS